MNMKHTSKLITVNEIKKHFMRIVTVILIGFMSVTVHAHNNGQNHSASPREKLVQRLGSESAAQTAINNMKPSARARFLAKERTHPRKVAAMEGKKAEIKHFTRTRIPAMKQMIALVERESTGCMNCHAITPISGRNITNQQMAQVRAVVGDLHPATTLGERTCSGCHSSTSNWHTPPSTSQNFNNMTHKEICEALSTPVGGSSVHIHLINDPLIRWAITSGNNPTTGRMPGGSVSRNSGTNENTWRNLVWNWVRDKDRQTISNSKLKASCRSVFANNG